MYWDNCTTAENILWADNTTAGVRYGYKVLEDIQQPLTEPGKIYPKDKSKKIEGVEMKNLYNVYLIYGEDRKAPEIHQVRGVIASSEEDAKIKSGLMHNIQDNWDADYLTFICEKIGEVKIKEKPKEVKNV